MQIFYISNPLRYVGAEELRSMRSKLKPCTPQSAVVYRVAMIALGVLAINEDEDVLGESEFNKLALDLRKPDRSVSDTLETLKKHFGQDGSSAVRLDDHTMEIFANLLCSEDTRKGIDYLIAEWPRIDQVRKASNPPPAFGDDEMPPGYGC